MVRIIVSTFFLSSIVFTATHIIAMSASLYWYLWWFDILMHTWGGVLIVHGLYTVYILGPEKKPPPFYLLLLALLVATVSWEIFERYFGLYNLVGYIADTTQDIFFAFTGGLLTHFFLRDYTMR